MRQERTSWAVCSTIVIMLLSTLVILPSSSVEGGSGPGWTMLQVGMQDKMKTLNPLPAIANDRSTHAVLDRVYDSLGKVAPQTEELLPFIIKGVDANENGIFDADEYGGFVKDPLTDPLDITAYYDFNGVYFHDGVQANRSDLFFSYQLQAMNPRTNSDVRVLMDRAGKSGTNYTTTRWLFMSIVPKIWEGEPGVGDPSLRFAVRFTLQEPFAIFARSGLIDIVLYPRHVWEDTGWRQTDTGPSIPLHADFGKATYPESDPRFGQGIPLTEIVYKPFQFLNGATPQIDSAEEWQLGDDDVIASGPFEFDSFNQVSAVAIVTTFDDYYTGNDTKSGLVIDPLISTYVSRPRIGGIIFSVWTSIILGVLALQSGTIDFYLADIPPEYIPELTSNPDITIWTSPQLGFTYVGYNMRRPAIGTWHYGQVDQFDTGYYFRKAVAHLINKTAIVDQFLSGYGIPGVVPVSPLNVKWYNSSLTGYGFDEARAVAEMDLAHQDALWLYGNGGPAEAQTWYTKDASTGKYIMPGIGTAEFYLWCPNADYDPVKANSCTMIATEMNVIGINVKAKPAAFSAVSALVNAHDFDMYISSWDIETLDPDYLHDFFHSSNAASGWNYIGFNNPTSDYLLEESRKALIESDRINLVKWEQAILWDKLPYDTLYFRDRIEAADTGDFVGWLQDIDTVWNYWSLLYLTPVNTPPSISIISPTGGESWIQGSSQTVTWTAFDDQDTAPYLSVWINYTSSAGGGSICGPVPGNAMQCPWTLPMIAATDVVVNATVVDTGGLKGFDESGPFAIQAPPPINTAPIVTILSPVGGEEWLQNSLHNITWTMQDAEEPDANLTVFVNCTTGGVTTQLATALHGQEYFEWTLPGIVANDTVVNITVIDSGGLKGWAQSGPFTIKAPQSPSDFLSEYWWILVAAIIVVVVMLVILLLIKRRRSRETKESPARRSNP